MIVKIIDAARTANAQRRAPTGIPSRIPTTSRDRTRKNLHLSHRGLFHPSWRSPRWRCHEVLRPLQQIPLKQRRRRLLDGRDSRRPADSRASRHNPAPRQAVEKSGPERGCEESSPRFLSRRVERFDGGSKEISAELIGNAAETMR